MKHLILFLFIILGQLAHSQVPDCERYTIFDLKDTLEAGAFGVFFKMTTDTNTYNTGYTDLFFVDQFSDTLNVYNWWGSWLPSTTNIPNDTVAYVLYYKAGISVFPSNFIGNLVSKNPECSIPFKFNSTAVDPLPEENEAFVIYPNPAQTKVIIGTKGSAEQLSKIELYNMEGKLVLKHESKLNEIDLTQLERGTYMLHVYSEDGKVQHRKIIKN